MLDSSNNNSSEGIPAFKGYSLESGAPVCDQFTSYTEYPVGETVSVRGDLKLCVNGIHVCLEPLDCLRFYGPDIPYHVIGRVTAYDMSPETERFCSKRVCRSVTMHEPMVYSSSDTSRASLSFPSMNYGDLALAVKERVREERYGMSNKPLTMSLGLNREPMHKTLEVEDHIAMIGGWSLGERQRVAISAGRYNYVASDYFWLDVAISFGRASSVEGIISAAFGSYSLARTFSPGGLAYTSGLSSIAVAEGRTSTAFADNDGSRAVAYAPFSLAIANGERTLVMLDSPYTLGIATGSVVVKAKGCAVVFPAWYSTNMESLPEKWGHRNGSVIGPDGTTLMFQDPSNSTWYTCVLRKGDKDFPADVEIDVLIVYERLRKKVWKNENNLG